ncbi:hypothetical protein DFP72DRAFT_315586 [Ephemerocybe angulata]|uniref:Uncharacterized protein n=1 Tax=Ephemerocybe angulata TaxID=980116 RepID=A0A8H6H6X4_9AGAR|nr:hypothetical protein DFP72DRAFT_315586 [Tulosesus angulatus]
MAFGNSTCSDVLSNLEQFLVPSYEKFFWGPSWFSLPKPLKRTVPLEAEGSLAQASKRPRHNVIQGKDTVARVEPPSVSNFEPSINVQQEHSPGPRLQSPRIGPHLPTLTPRFKLPLPLSPPSTVSRRGSEPTTTRVAPPLGPPLNHSSPPPYRYPPSILPLEEHRTFRPATAPSTTPRRSSTPSAMPSSSTLPKDSILPLEGPSHLLLASPSYRIPRAYTTSPNGLSAPVLLPEDLAPRFLDYCYSKTPDCFPHSSPSPRGSSMQSEVISPFPLDEESAFLSLVDEESAFLSLVDEESAFLSLVDEESAFLSLVDEESAFLSLAHKSYWPIPSLAHLSPSFERSLSQDPFIPVQWAVNPC